MKSIKTLLILLPMLFAACGEEFLNIPSETALTTGIYFQKQSDFQSAINAAYEPLRGLYSGNNGQWALTEMHSDNAHFTLNTDYRATIDQENAAYFIYEAANPIPLNQYRANYRVIARANQILVTIDAVEFEDAEQKDWIKGQALFLRGFAYFNLMTLFAQVPMHLVPVTTLEETALPLSERSDVFNQIKVDVTDAIALLPEKSEADYDMGRATAGAARMLLANVHMMLLEYPSAQALLEDIVASNEYSLVPDYADIFDPTNKNNSESIFEIQYRQGTDGYSSSFTYSFLPYPLEKDTVAKLTNVTNPNSLTLGEGYNTPSFDLIAEYEPGDLRYAATIDSVHTANAPPRKVPYCKKFTHDHQLLNNSDDNWPVFRYADALLLLAEALNEQGQFGPALDIINNIPAGSSVSIRGRAGLANAVAASQADVRDALRHERRIEMAFENKRWPDLVRYGIAETVIAAYGQNVKDHPEDYAYPDGYEPPPSAFPTDDFKIFWPLPAEEALYSPYF